MNNEQQNLAVFVLNQLYPDLKEKSVALTREIFEKYNLSVLNQAEIAYLAASIGTLAEKLETAENGDLLLDQHIEKCIKAVLFGGK